MRTKWMASLAAIATLAIFSAGTATAEMSERDLKRTLKQADRAWKDGRTDAAVKLYEQILESTENGDARRSGALYAVGLSALGEGDMDRAQPLLDELKSGSSKTHQLELAAVTRLLDAAAGAQGEIAQRDASLAEQKDLTKKASEESAELRDRLNAAQAQVASLEEQVAKNKRSQGSAAAKKAQELAECEEKLEKVRKSLVDRSGG